MMRAGSCSQFRFVVVWVMAAFVGRAENNKPPLGRLSKRRYVIA